MAAIPTLYYLIDLWISLTRTLYEAADETSPRFGTRAADLLIRAAVYLGSVEGRPMTTAKLASYVGIPRPTVERRLQAMQRRGIIERRGRTWCTPARLMMLRQGQDFSDAITLVRRTHDKMSRK